MRNRTQAGLHDFGRERNGDDSPETIRMAKSMQGTIRSLQQHLDFLESEDKSQPTLRRFMSAGSHVPALLKNMTLGSPYGQNIQQMGGHVAGGIEAEFKRLRGEFFMNMLFPDGDKKKKKRTRMTGDDPFADTPFARTQGSTASDTRLLTYSSGRDPTIELHRKAGQQRAVMVKELKENNQLMKKMVAGQGVVIELDDWGGN